MVARHLMVVRVSPPWPTLSDTTRVLEVLDPTCTPSYTNHQQHSDHHHQHQHQLHPQHLQLYLGDPEVGVEGGGEHPGQRRVTVRVRVRARRRRLFEERTYKKNNYSIK